MLLERMATWSRDKLVEFFQFIADKVEKLATWIGQKWTALFHYLTTQWQKLAAWIGQKWTALTEFMSDLKAMDRATLFTVVKELTFGAVINAADVGTDIYTALSHYQLLVASDQMK